MPSLRVLVVENDALIGLLLADMLAEMGHQVCAVEATMAGAVAAAARHAPDLLVVDAWLDEGSGVATVDQIILAGFVPHIFVSGDVSSVRACRPDAIIVQKPFREADLAHAIRTALAAAEPSGAVAPGRTYAANKRSAPDSNSI